MTSASVPPPNEETLLAQNQNPFFVSQYSSAFNSHMKTRDGDSLFLDEFHKQDIAFAYKHSHSFNPNVSGSNAFARARKLAQVGIMPAYTTERPYLKAAIERTAELNDWHELPADSYVKDKSDLPPAGIGNTKYDLRASREYEAIQRPSEQDAQTIASASAHEALAVKAELCSGDGDTAKATMSRRPKAMSYAVPGYQGYVAQEPFVTGRTYGASTRTCLAQHRDRQQAMTTAIEAERADNAAAREAEVNGDDMAAF